MLDKTEGRSRIENPVASEGGKQFLLLIGHPTYYLYTVIVLYYKMVMERAQSKIKLTTIRHNFNIRYQCYMVEEIVL